MNSFDSIGGYPELELPVREDLFPDAILLNSGRACLEYILRADKPKRLFLPKFSCDVLLEPAKGLSLDIEFYSVDENLELSAPVNIGEEDYLLYINYFGLKDKYCQRLSRQYEDKLIIDCSQALFYKNEGPSHIFYSPRKLVGVPDGGALISSLRLDRALPIATSYQRAGYLMKRIDLGAEASYGEFRASEESLSSEPLQGMSRLTRRLLGNIELEEVKARRRDNFDFLHKHLGQLNQVEFITQEGTPLSYPFWAEDGEKLRTRLSQAKVFTPAYWPNVTEWADEAELEFKMAKQVVHLPVDQRYDQLDMRRVVKLVREG